MKRASKAVALALDERRPQGKLGEFLDRILDEQEIRLHHSTEPAKNYLAVSPVLTKLFEELKEKASTMHKMKQIQKEFKSTGGGESSPKEPKKSGASRTTGSSYREPRPYHKDSKSKTPKIPTGETLTISDLIASLTEKDVAKADKPVSELFRLQEINDIFALFDPKNTAEQLFYKVVSCGTDYGECCVPRFEAVPDDLLVKLFLQCLIDAPRSENEKGAKYLKRQLGLVQDIVCKHGTLDLASMIDGEVDRYVREAQGAIDADMHLFRARAAITLRLKDHQLGEELGLEEFLASVLEEEQVKLHLPAEVAKKYLTLSPLVPLWFMTIKWQAQLLVKVSRQDSSAKVPQPDEPLVKLKKKALRKEHKRPAKSEL